MLRRTSNRKRKMIRRAGTALMAMALTVGMTVMGALASEADRMPALDPGVAGSLKVTMTYTDPNSDTDNVKVMPGVQVKLAQVAALEVNGGSADYTLLEEYKDTGIELAGMSASDSNEAAKTLAPLVPKTDIKTAATGTDGTVTFDGLEPGMYLVFQDTDANTAYRVDAIATFLAAVPLPVQAEEGNNWKYDVEIYPKTQLDGPLNNGKIVVTKQLINSENGLAYNPPENQSLTFYVGLFTDEACTVRAAGTTDMPLVFLNNSTSQAVFENLVTDQTYYIAETDGNGKVVPSVFLGDEVLFVAQYPNGQTVSITRQEPEREIAFRNATTGLPYGFYYGGKLTVTKKTVKNDEAYNTDDTFYAGLFTDPDFRNRYGDVIELKMDGSSSYSVTLDVNIGTSENDSATFYVTETDKNGQPLSEDGQEFTISVNKTGGKVTLSPSAPNDEVIITNTFGNGNSSNTGTRSNNSEGKEGPKTGDETPIVRYIVLMMAALMVIIAGILIGRRSKER